MSLAGHDASADHQPWSGGVGGQSSAQHHPGARGTGASAGKRSPVPSLQARFTQQHPLAAPNPLPDFAGTFIQASQPHTCLPERPAATSACGATSTLAPHHRLRTQPSSSHPPPPSHSTSTLTPLLCPPHAPRTRGCWRGGGQHPAAGSGGGRKTEGITMFTGRGPGGPRYRPFLPSSFPAAPAPASRAALPGAGGGQPRPPRLRAGSLRLFWGKKRDKQEKRRKKKEKAKKERARRGGPGEGAGRGRLGERCRDGPGRAGTGGPGRGRLLSGTRRFPPPGLPGGAGGSVPPGAGGGGCVCACKTPGGRSPGGDAAGRQGAAASALPWPGEQLGAGRAPGSGEVPLPARGMLQSTGKRQSCGAGLRRAGAGADAHTCAHTCAHMCAHTCRACGRRGRLVFQAERSAQLGVLIPELARQHSGNVSLRALRDVSAMESTDSKAALCDLATRSHIKTVGVRAKPQTGSVLTPTAAAGHSSSSPGTATQLLDRLLPAQAEPCSRAWAQGRDWDRGQDLGRVGWPLRGLRTAGAVSVTNICPEISEQPKDTP